MSVVRLYIFLFSCIEYNNLNYSTIFLPLGSELNCFFQSNQTAPQYKRYTYSSSINLLMDLIILPISFVTIKYKFLKIVFYNNNVIY